MTELNIQYPNAIAPALAAQQIVGNQQRNALLQKADMREEREYMNKRNSEALNEAAFHLSALSDLPEDQRAAKYPASVKLLKQFFGDVDLIRNAPDQYDPEFFDQATMRMKAIEQQAAMKRQPKEQWSKPVYDPELQQLVQENQDTKEVKAIGSRAPSTTVNMPPTEKEEGREWAKALVGDFTSMNERARASEGLVQQLEVARGIDVQKGALEPFKARIQKWVESMPGGDAFKGAIADATNAQALTGIMQNIVLSKMQAQKGPQTENDARRIEMTVASLGNTPEAFNFLMGAALALEKRNIDQRNFFLKYREMNQTLNGASTAWEEFKRDTPLMIKNPKSGLPVFWYDFRSANPDVPENVLLKNWREAAGG